MSLTTLPLLRLEGGVLFSGIRTLVKENTVTRFHHGLENKPSLEAEFVGTLIVSFP